jgi:hypothetical protein
MRLRRTRRKRDTKRNTKRAHSSRLFRESEFTYYIRTLISFLGMHQHYI